MNEFHFVVSILKVWACNFINFGSETSIHILNECSVVSLRRRMINYFSRRFCHNEIDVAFVSPGKVNSHVVTLWFPLCERIFQISIQVFSDGESSKNVRHFSFSCESNWSQKIEFEFLSVISDSNENVSVCRSHSAVIVHSDLIIANKRVLLTFAFRDISFWIESSSLDVCGESAVESDIVSIRNSVAWGLDNLKIKINIFSFPEEADFQWRIRALRRCRESEINCIIWNFKYSYLCILLVICQINWFPVPITSCSN